jgi:tetratricopeptide (TPR) repeat protein
MVREEEWVERVYYGGDLPQEAERCLHRAALSYQREHEAEGYLQEALRHAPDHIAVYIGLYKFYFYKGRLREALEYALRCLEKAAGESGLSPDWRRVCPHDAAFDGFNAAPRFYLFTLKAYGYIQMRLGNFEEGRAAIAKVMELDPQDKMGGSILLSILDRIGQDNQ